MALLRPLDVLVVAKLAANPSFSAPIYHRLAESLLISKSAAHDAVRRAQAAKLLNEDRTVVRKSVAELFVYGVRYFIPAELGPETRGVPTSHGVPPLFDHFGTRTDAPVWPSAEGTARGPSVEPIYETVPKAIQMDTHLYMMLAMIDAIRIGRAREVALAKMEIKALFKVEEW